MRQQKGHELDFIFVCKLEELNLISGTYFFVRHLSYLLAYSSHTCSHRGAHSTFSFVLKCVCIVLQVMHDVHAVIAELSESGNFIGHVHQLLASCPAEVLNLVKQSILQAVEPFKELLPVIMNVMIGVIVKRSNEVSRPLSVKGYQQFSMFLICPQFTTIPTQLNYTRVLISYYLPENNLYVYMCAKKRR
jgi:hypothetical protein